MMIPSLDRNESIGNVVDDETGSGRIVLGNRPTSVEGGISPDAPAEELSCCVSPDAVCRKTINLSRKRKSSKMVSFDLSIIQEHFSRVEITDDDVCELWHGSETRRRAKADAAAFRGASRDAPENDIESCTYLEHFKQALTITQSNGKLDDLVRTMSVDSPARGLEPTIVPGLMEARRRRIAMILRAQKRLPPQATPEQKAYLLREVSRNLSTPSRRLAQLLGVGDAKVVIDDLLKHLSSTSR